MPTSTTDSSRGDRAAGSAGAGAAHDADRHQPGLRRGAARRERRECRGQVDRKRARRRRQLAAMGGERLHGGVRGVHPDGGRIGRPCRRQAGVRRRLRPVHAGLGRVRAGAESRRARRGPRRAGDRRGDPGPGLAQPSQPQLPGALGARPRRRPVPGRRQPVAVGRPAGRRSADRVAGLARDLLHQRAGGRRRRLPDAPLGG